MFVHNLHSVLSYALIFSQHWTKQPCDIRHPSLCLYVWHEVKYRLYVWVYVCSIIRRKWHMLGKKIKHPNISLTSSDVSTNCIHPPIPVSTTSACCWLEQVGACVMEISFSKNILPEVVQILSIRLSGEHAGTLSEPSTWWTINTISF